MRKNRNTERALAEPDNFLRPLGRSRAQDALHPLQTHRALGRPQGRWDHQLPPPPPPQAPSPPSNPACAAPRPAHLPVRLRPRAPKVGPAPRPRLAPTEVAAEDAWRLLVAAWRGVAGGRGRAGLPVPRGQDFRRGRKTFSLAAWESSDLRTLEGRGAGRRRRL